jgi:pimeloyl-ACP methyl ester carboxylesterase
MTIVLLHGVPETADIWDDVRAALDAPSVALRLPGFGCPRPEGFSATKDAYVDWILNELKSVEGPIDLVGHDWGGGFTARIGTHYPDAVRSWTIDVAGVIHPDYVWHDFAQIWQTPGEGEKFWEDALAAPPDPTGPLSMADATMASCILDLYRSAMPNPHKDWGDGYGPSQKPCMVLTLTADPFTGGTESSSEVAKVLGAKEELFETGHFWPIESPKEGARIINEFVASLG